jgi:hypothetical protein
MSYINQGNWTFGLPTVIACALMLTACGGEENATDADATETPIAGTSSGQGGSAGPGPVPAPTPVPSPVPTPVPDGPGGTDDPGPTAPQSTPQIAGAAPASAMVGERYSFTPSASDADGDTLSFSAANLPAWLDLDPITGELSGTPEIGDLGYYGGIAITVSAGGDAVSLAAFAIDVIAVGTDSVTLTWTPPTENTDGSPLLDLAGYRIRYGAESGNYTASIELDNPGLVTYVIDGLLPGEYYFVISAFSSSRAESAYSNEEHRSL